MSKLDRKMQFVETLCIYLFAYYQDLVKSKNEQNGEIKQ